MFLCMKEIDTGCFLLGYSQPLLPSGSIRKFKCFGYELKHLFTKFYRFSIFLKGEIASLFNIASSNMWSHIVCHRLDSNKSTIPR